MLCSSDKNFIIYLIPQVTTIYFVCAIIFLNSLSSQNAALINEMEEVKSKHNYIYIVPGHGLRGGDTLLEWLLAGVSAWGCKQRHPRW